MLVVISMAMVMALNRNSVNSATGIGGLEHKLEKTPRSQSALGIECMHHVLHLALSCAIQTQHTLSSV